jgi:pimeloyl-ACP methyl ester carboxylesterase
VTIQRIDRPDGARSWVVAVPGTQSAAVAGPNPFDMRTNLELVGGVPDGVSEAVERAMVLAGIGADEPVLLAGHSQGGMVAASLAATLAGRYDVRAVLTAGSPDLRPRVPPGAQVLRLERATDGVPVLDGDPSPRDRPAVTTVTDPRAVGPLMRAHELTGYVAMAREAERALADDPSMAAWRAAADDVLGPPGSRSTTTQYAVRRLTGPGMLAP